MSSISRAPISRGPVMWGNLIIVYIVWGSTYLAIAVSTQTIPPLLAGGARFLVSSALIAIITRLVRGKGALRVTRAQLASALFLGVIMLSVGISTVSFAERYVPTGVAAIIIAVTPLVVVLLRAATGDRPRWPTVIGVIVGLGGLAWMLLPGGTHPVSGDDHDVLLWTCLLVVSSTLWATGAWLAQRLPVPPDSMTFTTYELLAPGIVMTALGFAIGERVDLAQVSTASWLGWGFLVVFGSVLAYSSFTWLIANARISLVSTYAYVNPVVAVLLGILILGETITSDVVIGLTVVLGGVLLVISGESLAVRRSRSSA